MEEVRANNCIVYGMIEDDKETKSYLNNKARDIVRKTTVHVRTHDTIDVKRRGRGKLSG